MEIQYCINDNLRKKTFVDILLSICKSKVSPFVLSGLVLSFTIPLAVKSAYNDKFKDFELIKAVATDEPYNIYKESDNKVIFNAQLPVDINDDGERDFYIQLAVNKTFKKSEKKPVFNIKKGDRLVLEGIVIKDIFGKNKSMDSIGNGVEMVEGRILVDKTRGAHYLNYKNIIVIENDIVNKPRKNENVSKLVNFLNQNER